jgi:hypothetical protein
MGIHIKSISEQERFFAVDIGSARIKVLLCEIIAGELVIIDSSSIRQSRKNMSEGVISDIQGVSDTLMRALDKMQDQAAGRLEVDSVIFALQSPYLITDTLSMNYVRESVDQPLTMEEIDTMVAKIEYKSLEKAKPKILSQIPLEISQMKLVTTSLSSITIDGKKVANPIGFTGSSVSLSVCNAFLPSSVFNLYSTIARKLDRTVISFVPAPIALPKSRAEALELFDPNCYVDVGSSITSIALENYSELLGAVQIPVGTTLLENMLMRKFPKKTRLEIEHCMHATERTNEEIGVFTEFFSLLAMAIQTGISTITPTPLLRNFYFSGASMTPAHREELFAQLRVGYASQEVHAADLLWSDSPVGSEYAVAYSLARSALELIKQSTDPIARILRFVIYRHE